MGSKTVDPGSPEAKRIDAIAQPAVAAVNAPNQAEAKEPVKRKRVKPTDDDGKEETS